MREALAQCAKGPRAQLFTAAFYRCGREGAGMERGISNRGRVWHLKPTNSLDLLCSSQCPTAQIC